MPKAAFPFDKPNSEWKQELTQKEFQCLRKAGTETPKTGEYYSFFPKQGYFACRACKHPLYSATSKFKDCGWVRCSTRSDRVHDHETSSSNGRALSCGITTGRFRKVLLHR